MKGKKMLTPLQAKLLEMFKWFHAYCVAHEITYYALGGTMLGAVRHEGFIPWDDDIDVGLPRADYEKLIACMRGEQRGRYILETPGENGDYGYLYGKLYDTQTTLTEHTRHKTRRGIFLDIFPLDGIGNTPQESKRNYKKILFRVNVHLTKVCAVAPHRVFYKNAAIVFARCIPETAKTLKKRAEKINRICASRPFGSYRYGGNLVAGAKQNIHVERAWFGEPKLYPFEDMQIFGPADAHAYLTALYGDYMQLPPEEKRVSNHDFLFLDLESSYLDSAARDGRK